MIRSATAQDVPIILSLIRELAAYEHLESACVATEDLLREHLFGPAPAASALILLTDTAPHTPVGYALYFTTFSTFLARPGIFLEDIYVQPAHRNCGLGKSVFRHLAQLCREKNYGRLEWSVLDWNAPSIAFYKSLGAVPLDEWQMMRLTGPALHAVAGSHGGSL
jgi:GNAT superfamily N-acetyltransferase